MIHDGHIGFREATALLVSFSTTKLFLSFPQEMVREGSTAAWQIPLLSGIWSALLIYAFLHLYRYSENQNIIQLGARVGGKTGGFITGLLYTVFFVILGSLVLREFTETVVATVLPGTPVSAVAIPFMLAILYLAFKGSETITRVALVFAPIVLVCLIFIFALDGNWMKVNNILPILGKGPDVTFIKSIFRTSAYSELTLIGLWFGFFRSQKEFTKVCVWSLGLTVLILTLVILFYTMIFPVETSARLPYPMYQISRMIYRGRFLQRVESVFVFLWVGSAVIKVGVCLWAATYSIAEGMRIPMYKPLLVPMALLFYACSFIPNNYPEAASWDVDIFRKWCGLFTFAIPLILLICFVFQERRRRRTV